MESPPIRLVLPAFTGLGLATVLILAPLRADPTETPAPRQASDREFRSVKKEFQQKIPILYEDIVPMAKQSESMRRAR